MERLLPTVLEGGRGVELTHKLSEEFHLAHAKRLLLCPVLTKRLEGVVQLKNIIANVERRAEGERLNAKQRQGYGGRGYGSGRNEVGGSRYLTCEYVAEWLVEERIVEILMGAAELRKEYTQLDARPDIIKRSDTVFEFMCRNAQLKKAQLDALWRAQADEPKNKELRRDVYCIVHEIVQLLPEEGVVYLFQLVRTCGTAVDDFTIELVKEVTSYGIYYSVQRFFKARREGKERGAGHIDWFGLELLWRWAQNQPAEGEGGAEGEADGGLSAQTVVEAQNALCELLSKPYCQTKLIQYLDLCVDNVRSAPHRAVTHSLELAQRLIDSQSDGYGQDGYEDENRSNSLTKSALIETLNRNIVQAEEQAKEQAEEQAEEEADSAGLLGLLVDELQRFHASRNPSAESEAEESEAEESAHSDAMHTRLSFLLYVLTQHAALKMPFEQVASLWHCFAFDSSDSELFFHWLKEMKPQNSYGSRDSGGALSEQTVGRVFHELFCTANERQPVAFAGVGESGFLCFHHFFNHVNTTERRLYYTASAGGASSLSIEDPSLLLSAGCSTLWDFALCATAPAVAERARSLLTHLQLKVNPSVKPRGEVWEAFVRECMRRIAAATETLTSTREPAEQQKQQQTIERLLTTLMQFLTRVERTMAQLNKHNAHAKIEIKLLIRCGKGVGPTADRETALVLPRTTTVQQLRAKIARDTMHKGGGACVKLRLNNGQPTLAVLTAKGEGLRTLGELQRQKLLGPRTWVVAELLAEPTSDTAHHLPSSPSSSQAGSESRQCASLLSNDPTHFALLFRMLALNSNAVTNEVAEHVAERVWELLDVLPLNDTLLLQMGAIGSKDRPQAARKGKKGKEKQQPPSPQPASPQSDVAWEELLSSQPASAMKLLYQLRVLDSVLTAGDGETSMDAWVDGFIQAGGFEHVHRILLTCDVQAMTAHALKKNCLSELVRLVEHFLEHKEDSTLADSALVERMDRSGAPPQQRLLEMVQRLLEVLRQVSLAALLLEPEPPSAAVDPRVAAAHVGEPPAPPKQTAEAELIRNTMRLLVSCTTKHPALLEMVYDCDGLQASLLEALLGTPEAAVRVQVGEGILCMCSTAAEQASKGAVETRRSPLQHFLPLLLDALPGVYKHEETCGDYFALVHKLLLLIKGAHQEGAVGTTLDACLGGAQQGGQDGSGQDGSGQDGSASRAVAVQLAAMINRHPLLEQAEDDEPGDLVLRGLLRTLTAVFTCMCSDGTSSAAQLKAEVCASPADPDAPPSAWASRARGSRKGLIHEVFNECLFAIPTQQSRSRGGIAPPKCKSRESRQCAFDLLLELVNGCAPNLHELLELMLPYHRFGNDRNERRELRRKLRKRSRQKKMMSGQELVSRENPRSSSGYVGLENLGCTCYMNSCIQQFFMIPAFRRELASITIPADGDGVPAEDNLLLHLQIMFAQLQETERQYFNPKAFCHAYKDSEGRPIDPIVQQDANEFVTFFFTQLEERVNGKGKQIEGLFKRYFGAQQSSILTAKGQFSEKRQIERYTCIPVKDECTNTLEEGLRKFIEPEEVDYKWETKELDADGKPVLDEKGKPAMVALPTTKRTLFTELPEHLIFHLKRFDFCFETFATIKFNKRVEFPDDLDMFPYTMEGVDPAELFGDGEGDEAARPVLKAKSREYYLYKLKGIVAHSINSPFY
jgi:hypothetical protein